MTGISARVATLREALHATRIGPADASLTLSSEDAASVLELVRVAEGLVGFLQERGNGTSRLGMLRDALARFDK
jgi:hypothetical protein